MSLSFHIIHTFSFYSPQGFSSSIPHLLSVSISLTPFFPIPTSHSLSHSLSPSPFSSTISPPCLSVIHSFSLFLHQSVSLSVCCSLSHSISLFSPFSTQAGRGIGWRAPPASKQTEKRELKAPTQNQLDSAKRLTQGTHVSL